jgi:hypothetical protein
MNYYRNRRKVSMRTKLIESENFLIKTNYAEIIQIMLNEKFYKLRKARDRNFVREEKKVFFKNAIRNF